MIVLPTAIALLLKKGYKSTLFLSILFSLVAMLGGLTISYYLEWAPGATIVMATILLLVLVLLYRGILVLIYKQKEKRK